jgi:hypothetical protein
MVARIISMWVSEQAASVRVEFRYPTAYPGDKADFRKPPPGFERTEYLSLIKFKNGWRIVTRVISVIGSETARNYSLTSPGNVTRLSRWAAKAPRLITNRWTLAAGA